MQDNEKFQVVSTKVSPEAYSLLQMLCKKKGINTYEFLQMVIDTLIRYMDSQHNLHPDLEQAMSIFDHMDGWPTVNFADPNSKKGVHEATYFYTEEGKRGGRAVHVEMPFMGEKIATCNVQDITEKTFCLMFPSLYKRLRLVGAVEECNNVLETIDILCRMHEKDIDAKAIRESFEDNNASLYGVRPVDAPYRRHTRRGADNLADRRQILGEEEEIFKEDGTQQTVYSIDELKEMEDAENSEADS